MIETKTIGSINFGELNTPESIGKDLSSCGLLDKQIASHHKLKGVFREN